MATRSSLRLQPEEPAPGPLDFHVDSWKRFFVVLAGKTNGVHESVVKHFKSLGQTETTSPGDADYCLVFCPVVSRVGRDISKAMDHLLPGKEAVLVVMHQTFNREQVIPPSSRLVEDQRVRLTLDCLFHQDKLLKCELNKNIKANIKKFFKESKSKESNRRQRADSLDPVLKAFNDLKEENRTMKQQQMVLVHEIEALQVQNDEKDKKIQESQNYMSELKQNVPSLVKSGPKDGPGPVVSGGEPGSMEDQGAASFLYEDITKYFKSKEESNRLQQVDSLDPVLKAFNDIKEENRTMKQQQTVLDQKIETLQFQNDEKDKKIQELQNDMSELKQKDKKIQELQNDISELKQKDKKIQELQNDMSDLKQKVASLVKSGSKDGPGPVVSGEEPRSPDQHTESSVKSRSKDGPCPVVSGEEPRSPDQHTEPSVKSGSKGGTSPTKTEEPGSLEDQGAASFRNKDGTKIRRNVKVGPRISLKNVKPTDCGKDKSESNWKDPKGGSGTAVTEGEPGFKEDQGVISMV